MIVSEYFNKIVNNNNFNKIKEKLYVLAIVNHISV